MPSKHPSIVRREEAILLYALLKGYKINVGKIIEKFILVYSKGNYKGMIPHLGTITRVCIQGGVEKEWGIKEIYPRASPLTLTGITKGLNVKPEKNSIFLKKGKTVISVENRKFSRSRMTKRIEPLNSFREI